MSARQVVIYALVDDAGQIHYIGQTRRLELRRREHRRQRPTLTMIVVTVTDEAQADEVERHWIDYYRGQGRGLLNAKDYRPGGRGRRAEGVAVDATTTIGVWLSRADRGRLERIARQENRSVHGQIRQFIDEALVARAATEAQPAEQAEGDGARQHEQERSS